jgi:hypothetical protein
MFENTPSHEQKEFANTTLYWFSTDSKDEYEKNLKHNTESLVTNNWLVEDVQTSIPYTFNAEGFRSREINVNDPGIAVFGCSFTAGVGLPMDKVYHYYIGKELNLPVDNFGVLGSSNATSFRIAQYWLPMLRPKIVILQTTFADRFEIINENSQSVVLAPLAINLHNRIPYYQLYRQWILNDANGIFDKQKNELAIRYLCHTLDIPIFVVDVNDFTADKSSPIFLQARDLMHPGVQPNQLVGLQLTENILKTQNFGKLYG